MERDKTDPANMGVFSYLSGTDGVNGDLYGKLYHSRGVRKMAPAEEYRINAATCLRLAKTMDHDNKQRLEDIAQQWLDLAREEERLSRFHNSLAST